jgi:hypothetical protein
MAGQFLFREHIIPRPGNRKKHADWDGRPSAAQIDLKADSSARYQRLGFEAKWIKHINITYFTVSNPDLRARRSLGNSIQFHILMLLLKINVHVKTGHGNKICTQAGHKKRNHVFAQNLYKFQILLLIPIWLAKHPMYIPVAMWL